MIPPPPTSTLFPYTTLFRSPAIESKTLVTIGKDVYTNIDFGNYIRNNARTRMGVAKGTPNKEIVDKVFSDFVSEKADRKSTRLNSSHPSISYAVFCLKKKKN